MALVTLLGCGKSRAEDERWLRLLSETNGNGVVVENSDGKPTTVIVTVERKGNKDYRSLFFQGTETPAYQEVIEYDDQGRKRGKRIVTPTQTLTFVWDENYWSEKTGRWKPQ
jgi:hypothetical protein